MAVYVDELRTYPMTAVKPDAQRHGRTWCHLTADTAAELHAFAERIGLRREWFQHGHMPHYDLTPGRRCEALRAGAIEVSAMEQARQRISQRLGEGG